MINLFLILVDFMIDFDLGILLDWCMIYSFFTFRSFRTLLLMFRFLFLLSYVMQFLLQFLFVFLQ